MCFLCNIFGGKFIRAHDGSTSALAVQAPSVNDSTNSVMFPQDDNTNAFLANHENYNEYVDYPNILGPLNQNAAYHDLARVHAPFAIERNVDKYVSSGGVHFFDSADETIQKVGRSELQVQFDSKREVPIPPALIPSSGVEVPRQAINYGWSQVDVPQEGMYQASVLVAPSQKLSRGINVNQVIANDSARPSLAAKAPKQKRSVR